MRLVHRLHYYAYYLISKMWVNKLHSWLLPPQLFDEKGYKLFGVRMASFVRFIPDYIWVQVIGVPLSAIMTSQFQVMTALGTTGS